MSIEVLDSSAWREFRGTLSNSGINKTTHLAKIADISGKLRDCVVKLLPLNYPSLLGEAIGWELAQSSGLSCAPFAAIVMVPISSLRECMDLPSEFDGMNECPAWCCELVAGKSVRQVHKWLFWLARQQCLMSKDARKIASFDLWTDLMDRNYGNVIRVSNSTYISIDHETILHDLLWKPTGKTFEQRSLLLEAKQKLSPSNLLRFQMDMANASTKHADAISTKQNELSQIIAMIYPHMASTLIPLTMSTLTQRSQSGWLANTLGVIA
ncbi:hypothetical protein ICN18_01365 [Polynucleobacter sp. Ross1-W9]|uniref:hypothetical protein n=1 Tax=Polynucleobacter parvulilacunae TaxID=1855631 RepID=UPI001C0DE889|nr:hypothetical protein [Polynucleobacter parvulilacunae]MBU3556274.1 hypothetical protein [Polynucleobacter parvulilacunae]